jgi:cellulose synthase/poly-beta-1,6-N-acetylglucosamine synthase-like glycosyltransferase
MMSITTAGLKEKPLEKNPEKGAIHPITILPLATGQRQLPRVEIKPIKNWSIVKWGIVAIVGGIFAYRLYQQLFIIDPIVGIYSLLVAFLILVPLAFTLLRYKDPSSLYSGNNGQTNRPISIISQTRHMVSIIIPARNEPKIIKNTVAACLASSYTNIEIILVNDGSNDETGEVMDLLHRENPGKVRVIHLSNNVGKRGAIREAILHAKIQGDIIILHDSDSIVERTAIERIVNVFNDPSIGAVSCNARPLNANRNLLTKMQDTWYSGSYFVMKGMESSFGSVTCCTGVLSAYRKEAIMPCLDAWSNDRFLGVEFRPGDDRHLTSYLIGGSKHYLGKQNKVWKTSYCESAIAFTEVPSTFKEFINQQIRWKKSWIRVFLFTAPFYFKNRSPIAASIYYIQMLLSIIGPVIAVRNLVFLPLIGNYQSAVAYFLGVLFIGFIYAMVFKARNPGSGNRWLYRLLISLLSLLLLSPLLYYSLLKIKQGKAWNTR